MSDLRAVIQKMAPDGDPDEVMGRSVLLIKRIEPEVGLLLTASGRSERQVVLHCHGVQLPAGEQTVLDIAMPGLLAARLGTALMDFYLDEAANSLVEDPPMTSTRTPSPYL
jgi:hypothetical protein